MIAARPHRAVARLSAAAAIRPGERVAAGRFGAAVWSVGGASIAVMALALPGHQTHRIALLALAVAGCLWGLASGLLLGPRRLTVWVIHLSVLGGVAGIGAAIALSGGSTSPAWGCLFYVVVFAAYFMRPATAGAYFAACLLVEALTVVLAAPDTRAAAAARLAVAGPAFLVLGGAIVGGKRFMWGLRRDAERLAAEQGALRRVATAVVGGISEVRFYEMVAVEAADLIGVAAAAVLRRQGPQEVELLGHFSRDGQSPHDVGDRFRVPVESDLGQALQGARPMRAAPADPNGTLGRLGYATSIVVPIAVSGRPWGCLVVAARTASGLTPDHEHRLTEFTGLLAASIANIEDRARLAAQASTDPLTGVANHRTFYERLSADLARARRYGSPVAVAVIDIDHFKAVNDAGGHEAGDDRLIRVAHCLSDAARAEDTLARIGGDEFGWILPETTAHEAMVALERLRRVITETTCQAPPPRSALRREIPQVTISAGVCDSNWSADPTELVRLADQALYSSKENGRDQVRLYVPAEGEEGVVAPSPGRHRAD